MPTSQSATKRVKTAKRNEAQNRKVKNNFKEAIKEFEAAVEAEDVSLAEDKLKAAKKEIDKSVSKGVLHKNTAARKKSKLERKFNQLAN
ncbi:MAG: 30S ribosomal protein S20 [Bacillota bacterium]